MTRPALRPIIAFAGLAALVWVAPGLVVVALGVMLGVLLATAVGGFVALRLLRRGAEQVLADRPHLTRLGHRFEHRYTDLRVTEIGRDDQGRLVLSLVWSAQQTIELDEDGLPDGVTTSGPSTATWVLPTPELEPEQEAALRELPSTEVELVEHGSVALEGLLVTSRELVAANGVTLQMAPRVDAGR